MWVYFRYKVIGVFFLGFASGIPLALTASTLSVWLTEVGVNKATIGLFAAVGTPYALKFLWAPFLDTLMVPLLSQYFGRRSGWILLIQFFLMASMVGMGFSDPTANALHTAGWALLVAIFSASQDIVIDAYRVELLSSAKGLQAPGVAMHVLGYRVGMLVSSAGALFLAEDLSWFMVYSLMAMCISVGLVAVLLLGEPEVNQSYSKMTFLEKAKIERDRQIQLKEWLKQTIIEPFTDFMKRHYWAAILIFIILYKIGDALAGVMTSTFLIEIGFSKTEIATIAKTYGFIATLLGSFIGGALVYKFGVLHILWIGGMLQMLSNLMFAVQAYFGYDTHMLAVTIGIENLSGGIGTSAFVAYISGLCSVRFTASQYALLSSLSAFGRTILGAYAGILAEAWDWVEFFVLTTAAAIPGLLMLWYLTYRVTSWERSA